MNRRTILRLGALAPLAPRAPAGAPAVMRSAPAVVWTSGVTLVVFTKKAGGPWRCIVPAPAETIPGGGSPGSGCAPTSP